MLTEKLVRSRARKAKPSGLLSLERLVEVLEWNYAIPEDVDVSFGGEVTLEDGEALYVRLEPEPGHVLLLRRYWATDVEDTTYYVAIYSTLTRPREIKGVPDMAFPSLLPIDRQVEFLMYNGSGVPNEYRYFFELLMRPRDKLPAHLREKLKR